MGLIGEMRKVGGRVSFGGRVAYCAQTAWIQNATLVSLVPFIKSFIYLFNFAERKHYLRTAIRRRQGASYTLQNAECSLTIICCSTGKRLKTLRSYRIFKYSQMVT